MTNPQPTVTGVTASWNVSTVSPSTSNAFAAAWIGIGGDQFDKTLIQCGTEEDSIFGQTRYSAWYELLPNNSITIPTINISPGDVIQASIQLTNGTLNQWVINLTDTANGQTFQNTFTYNSSQLSAEWIVERPTINGAPSRLADFGAITFYNCTATIGSTTGPIESFPENPLVMYSSTSRNAVQLTDVSALNSDGNSFTVNYLASG
jgi:hypothetical protein